MKKETRGGARGGGARATLIGLMAALVAGVGGYQLAKRLGADVERAEEARAERPFTPSASLGERRPVGESSAAAEARRAEQRWVEENNRARRLLEEGRLVEAVELFEACHAAVPEDPIFRRNLAEALFRLASSLYDDGDREGAIERLERAVATAPEREELAELLERWRREMRLSEGDTYSLGAYFRVEYDGGRADLVQHAQELLDFLEGGGRYREGAYEMLRNAFGVDPVLDTGEKLRVVVYDRKELDEYTGRDWVGGIFDGVIRVAVDDLQRERVRWERILCHELVHAFVREVGGRDVPGWLNEGLAQLHEERNPDLSTARATLRGHELFPLERLQDSLATWEDRDEISRAYAQSLVFVAFLRDTVGDAGLAEILAACKRGETPDRVAGVPLSTYLADLVLDLAAR